MISSSDFSVLYWRCFQPGDHTSVGWYFESFAETEHQGNDIKLLDIIYQSTRFVLVISIALQIGSEEEL